MGSGEWASDPRFVTNAGRVENRHILEPKIEAITLSKTTQYWLDVFEGSGLPYAKVDDLMDTLNHKHVRARNMVVEVEHKTLGKIELVNTPVKYGYSRSGVRSAPPLLGEHTDEVLKSLGLDEGEVRDLRGKGVVG